MLPLRSCAGVPARCAPAEQTPPPKVLQRALRDAEGVSRIGPREGADKAGAGPKRVGLGGRQLRGRQRKAPRQCIVVAAARPNQQRQALSTVEVGEDLRRRALLCAGRHQQEREGGAADRLRNAPGVRAAAPARRHQRHQPGSRDIKRQAGQGRRDLAGQPQRPVGRVQPHPLPCELRDELERLCVEAVRIGEVSA